MRKIYILLMYTYTIPSKLIKAVTNYEYSHVAIALDKECNVIYSFGRRKVDSILNGGFVVEEKDGEFFRKFNKTNCKIYEKEITEKQYRKVKKTINRMKKNQELYKYDFIGIVLRFFKIPVTFKNRYVCSYFVAHILEKGKIYEFDKESYFVEPRDFEKLPNLKEIYHGRYLVYN